MGKSKPRPVICRGCGREFTTCWPRQRFCTKPCQTAFFNSVEFKASVDRGACSVDGCTDRAMVKGMCNMHYSRVLKHGSTEDPAIARREKRFWAKVQKTDTCWNWTGRKDKHGYGAVTIGDGRSTSAHRYSYELAHGSAPKELDHACHNPSCVNPDHLRPVTRGQNAQNRRGARRDSKSGVRGVFLRGTRWCAEVHHQGKRYSAGRYDTIKEAEAAAIAKRNELFTHNEADRRTA